MSSCRLFTRIERIIAAGWLVLACLMAGPKAALAQGEAPTDTITLTRVVASGLVQPVHMTAAPGDRSRLFVVEKLGRIRIVTIVNGVYTLQPTPFLDIDPLVGSSGGEQGLLSMAFHPSYRSNGYFFVDYTDNGGNTVVARYTVSGNPNLADPNSALTVLTQTQPYPNHNGGQLQFGADGMLYIAFGDGGSGGDPQQNAQNTGAWLGKILRIDVDSGTPYAVPANNPWAGSTAVRPEIWSLGLRNPWRFSFDRLTGDMWIGDVGQGTWEEVDLELNGSPGGINWGWRCREGHAVYDPSPSCPSPQQPVLAPPIYDYDQTQPSALCAITGGYVYRGSPNSSFFGRYFFIDYCNPLNQLWTLSSSGGGGWARTDYTIAPPAGQALSLPSSFGEDAIGDLYVSDYADGEVYKLNLRPATCIAGNYDVNGDGAVTIVDIILVAGDWYRIDYIPDLDVDCNQAVNVIDVQLVANALSTNR
jgi:glucose/arabinose dehydrogenase